jgi:hypothetical protein
MTNVPDIYDTCVSFEVSRIKSKENQTLFEDCIGLVSIGIRDLPEARVSRGLSSSRI